MINKYIKIAIKFILAALLAVFIFFVFISITTTSTININTYGVLARMNPESHDYHYYVVRNVRIEGVLRRRIIDHGFRGGYFNGNFHIEDFDFLEGFDIESWIGVRPAYTAIFSYSTREGGIIGFFSLIYHAPMIPILNINIHGRIGFSNSLNTFAMQIFEVRDEQGQSQAWRDWLLFTASPPRVWDGLIFAAPANTLEEANTLFWSLFEDGF